MELIASAVRREVAKAEVDQEEMIAHTVRQEVARNENNPPLPEGNDYVTLDEHLSDELVQDIVSDKYVNLSRLSTPSSVRADEEYNVVYDRQGNKVLKPVRSTKEIDNIFKYLRNMFILGACYLRHKADCGPQFLQYLYNILEDNRHFKFKAVMTYDERFRTHRERCPNFSWARVHEVHHTNLNKYHNVRPSGGDFPSTSHPTNHGQNSFSNNNATNDSDREIQQLCKRFNRGALCLGPCKYAHTCWHCFKKGHPGVKCWSKKGGRQ